MIRSLMLASAAGLVMTGNSFAQTNQRRDSCEGLPSSSALKPLLAAAVKQTNGGLAFNSWATIVANDGTVCAIAFSGGVYTDQWLASRVVSAQKASTANSLSLGKVSAGAASANGNFALSTANLYAASQPGGNLYGLDLSNPVDTDAAYSERNRQPANSADFGTNQDPMIGRPIGGVSVLGGGLALYDASRGKVGGVGVGGDTSCTDHVVAWRLRRLLGLDYLKSSGVGGLAAFFSGDSAHPDNIIFDLKAGQPSGFGHPTCLNNPPIDSTTNTPTSLEPVR